MPRSFYLTLACLLLGSAPTCAAETLGNLAADLAPLKGRSLGPAAAGGRVTALAVEEKDPNTQYVGTAGGGVWKTTDDGFNWTPIFEGKPNPSIGAVALAPSNPDVVWVGTGEANARNSVSWGNGVFRSTDGGKTWQAVGLKDSQHIGRIIVHPRDPATAWVAALGHLWGPNRERGIFRTVDAGKTWQHVLNLGPDTGCVDLAIEPGDPQTLYAAGYCVRRDGFAGGNPAIQFGPRAGLYRSRDAGKTWVRLSQGLPTRPLGRCGLAVSARNPKIVFAVIQTDLTDIRQVAGQQPRHSNLPDTGGIFCSHDRGETWVKLNDLCPRPFYYGQIRVDPRDEQRIYVLGVSLYISNDGGRTFRAEQPKNVHVDHHDLWIDPHSNQLILGNDGGLYYSTDRSAHWEGVFNLPIAQFYGIGLDGRKPYRIYGGLQDNGSWGGPSRTRSTSITNADWFRILGFDGFQCQVDPLDQDIIYAEGQYGRLFRVDLRSGKNVSIRPAPTGRTDPPFRFNWNAPILLSPHDPRVLYYGGNHLFRSTNRGDSWEIVSPDLTRAGPGPSQDFGHTLTTLAESPVKPGILYAGSDDGKVLVSRTGGRVWYDLSARLPGVPAERWITRIVCSPFQVGTAWLSLTRHRQDDRAPYLFRTDDFGTTWKPLANNLPQEGSIHVILPDPRQDGLLYAGTEFGLFVSFDAGASWQPFGSLPPAAVHDLAIHSRERELVVATHGRSLYVIDIGPLQELTRKVRAEPAHLFEILPVALPAERTPNVVPRWTYAAPNPADGAVISYRLKDKLAMARLSVLDRKGKTVAELPCSSKEGLHQVVWDLRRTDEAGKKGLHVSAGEYAVRLNLGDVILSRTFRVLAE